MDKLKRITRKLRRKMKTVDVSSLISELETHGYNTVFFNTKQGDMVLEAYGLDPGETRAFTYCGATKIVFVDENLHIYQKLCSLLHELGHILMGHLGDEKRVTPDVRLSEIEADAFAYEMLQPRFAWRLF